MMGGPLARLLAFRRILRPSGITGYLEAHYASGNVALIPVLRSRRAQLREAARVMSRNLQIKVRILAPDDRRLLWTFVNGSDVEIE